MKLSELLASVPDATTADSTDRDITSVIEGSQHVIPGAIFVARIGENTDGHDFIGSAIERGAVAVVGERQRSEFGQGVLPSEVPYVRVPCAAQALAWLSAAFHGFPAHNLVMVGVTGTDGKTTTSNLIHNIMAAAGINAGLISTVNAVIGDEVLDTGFHVTTPDAPAIQGYLARMLASGITHCVLETTSHGLSQHRVDACDFDLAVVTNITHEHLDYHGSSDAYLAAKSRLFEHLSTSFPKRGIQKMALLNRDDDSYHFFRDLLGVLYSSYGKNPTSDLRAEDIECTSVTTRFTASTNRLSFPVETSLIGDFNVMNCLAAIACALHGMDIDPEAIQRGISGMSSIPGRMERIDLGQDFTAIVDFAHTPNSLRCALETVRHLTDRRVIVVFGSAGLRDVAKRSWMGEIAAELADYTVITAEDPRTEPLHEIMEETVVGCIRAGAVEGEEFWRVPDRNEAIHFAASLATSGDVVMLCGKAHEKSMCFGDIEYPWDDRLAMRAAVARQLGQPEPIVPELPTAGKGVLALS